MGVLEAERAGGRGYELAHRLRRLQRLAVLGMPEPRQVQRHQVSMFRELPPDRLKGQQALGPRAEQERVITAVVVLADGKPDGETTDEPEPHLEGRVQPGGHDRAPRGSAAGDRIPDIVATADVRSNPPGG